MGLVELLTDQERLACECLFGLTNRAAAEADGKMDDREFGEFELLLDGRAADVSEMLPGNVHLELGSRPDLSQELLAYDKKGLAMHLAGSEGTFLPAADVEIHLQAFVDRATDQNDRELRTANARGVIFEAIFFGIRTAMASGGFLGSKVSSQEVGALSNVAVNLRRLLGETSLGVTDDDMKFVLKYAVLPKAAW